MSDANPSGILGLSFDSPFLSHFLLFFLVLLLFLSHHFLAFLPSLAALSHHFLAFLHSFTALSVSSFSGISP